MKLKSFSLKVTLAATLLISCCSTAFAQTLEQDNEAALLNNQALQLEEDGRYGEALELFNRSIAIGENQIRLYNRSFVLFRLEKYDEALRDINKVLVWGMENVNGLSLRALIHSTKGNHAGTFDDLNQMLRLEPNNVIIAIRRGNVAITANKYVQALDSYFYTEILAQKEVNKTPQFTSRTKSIPTKVGSVYTLLGLPHSSFAVGKGTSLSDSFITDFTPKPNELRFDGICSSVDTKAGVFSFDTLAVSFPNGKTKVLAQPKRKIAKLSEVKTQNSHSLEISGPLKVGDFVVVTGVDNAKGIATRAIALGMPRKHSTKEKTE